MKRILVLGAGKSATVLIRTLLETCAVYNWHLTVADQDPVLAMNKIGGSIYGSALEINVNDGLARTEAVRNADLVISLLPPSLHYLIALDCLVEGRNLLTASYADEKMLELDSGIRAKGLLFLCEMGLDPGIDHMSAMALIDKIRVRGGKITSFLSHCGGLVAPESDDNPWHYKISWNPANVVAAGKSGAVFLQDQQLVELEYEDVIDFDEQIIFPRLGRWNVYPNRDSMRYRSLYALEDTQSFMRTTIRHPQFMKGWRAVVKAGLTAETPVDASSFAAWSAPVLPFMNRDNIKLIHYLGILEDRPLPASLNSAQLLQQVLEQKLAMKNTDKDMILMLHQIDYVLDGRHHREESSFRLDGFDSSFTAMATTVGLPLAHAAVLILQKEIGLTGVQIPTSPAIYEKVLPLLEQDGIVFNTLQTLL